MGRSIYSATARIDQKISQWETFSKMLPKNEREAFLELVKQMKNRRSAIESADEPDIGLAMLLVAIVHLKATKGDQNGTIDWNESVGPPPAV